MGSVSYCDCECRDHTFPYDDPRLDMVRLLTAEAHNDYELLVNEINTLDDDRRKVILLLMTKYAIAISKIYGEDPVETIQKAALFFAGGEPSED